MADVPGVAVRMGMAWQRHTRWRTVEHLAHDPEAAQAAVLAQLLTANRATAFGRRHDFGSIRSSHDWARRVPTQDYASLASDLDAQRQRGAVALTAEPPLFYAQTSGTSGTPKYIPVTPTMLQHHRADQALFSFLQYRAVPAAFGGRAFGVLGAAVEGRLDSGHVVGSISGRLYAALPSVVRSRLVVPPSVASIADHELRYQTLALLALLDSSVTYAGSPNPSTFVRLLDVLNRHREGLLGALESGQWTELDRLPPEARSHVVSRLRVDAARARDLAALPEIGFDALWPRLSLVTTWTGGSCGIPLASLRRRLPPETRVMELGYQATECRGTLPLAAEDPSGLPPLHHTYFEFADPTTWDAGARDVIPLEGLEVGRQYYVLVTTAAGLYRYFMNDLVEVTGRFHATPLLRFVQKGRGVTSVTGEKLYEGQALVAVQDACDARGLAPSFFVLVAVEEPAHYRLYLEGTRSLASSAGLAVAVDDALGRLNMEYASKRASGRLGPLVLVTLRQGAGAAYREACVRAGQREGQLKPPALTYHRLLAHDLDTEADTEAV